MPSDLKVERERGFESCIFAQILIAEVAPASSLLHRCLAVHRQYAGCHQTRSRMCSRARGRQVKSVRARRPSSLLGTRSDPAGTSGR